MKYGKLAGSEFLEFSLDGKVLLNEEVAEEYNRLKAAHEYKMAQLSQKYEAIVAEHEELTTDHLILKTELAIKDKKLGEMLAENS